MEDDKDDKDDKDDNDEENGDSSVSSPRSQQEDVELEPPVSPSSSLYMNPKERERQEQLLAAKKLAKEKAQRGIQTTTTYAHICNGELDPSCLEPSCRY